MAKREVTEFDLRAPEFQQPDTKPEDYEFRDDGKVVRKDRWEIGLRNIASIIGWTRKEYEVPDVVEEVRRLKEKNPERVELTNLKMELSRLIEGEPTLGLFPEVEELRARLDGVVVVDHQTFCTPATDGKEPTP